MNAPLRPPPDGPLTILPPELIPPVEHLVIEDGAPVDSIYSEKQMRLLTAPLYDSWPGPGEGRPFLALANVGMFYGLDEPPLVPDILLALVKPPSDLHQKAQASYFFWVFGKPPHVVIEVVSNKEGDELGGKMATYAEIGIPYYIVWDPFNNLSANRLQVFGLHVKTYRPMDAPSFPEVGLGLSVWHGEYEQVDDDWLRWSTPDGQLIPTGRERAERLAAKLREVGIDPNTL